MVAAGGTFPADDGISSGGEDWPDAYRWTPLDPSHAACCWHPEWSGPAFHIYFGFLFGKVLEDGNVQVDALYELAQVALRALPPISYQ